MLNQITFYIVGLEKDTIEAFSKVFGNLPNFDVRKANITSQKADVIVSPANSYGLMDGGVDKPINYSLNYISEKVQKIITVVLTGFCTGAGQMDKIVAAKQMRLAYDLTNVSPDSSWSNANLTHLALCKIML